MKRFNKTLLAIALTLTASEAFAADALVVDTTPLMGSVIKVQNVPETRMVCNSDSNDGLIEKGVVPKAYVALQVVTVLVIKSVVARATKLLKY
jgi:hypothetical protein